MSTGNQSGDEGGDIDIKEQDRFLPIANVARIMKKSMPENAKIAKEAKECVQECVSEFISFITSEYPFYARSRRRNLLFPLVELISGGRYQPLMNPCGLVFACVCVCVGTASDRCLQEKRKTINGEDILWAMQSLGFENYAETLKIYLQKYREATKHERVTTTAKKTDGEGDAEGHEQQIFIQ